MSRFYVVSVDGYAVPNGRRGTSFSVLDSAQNHLEVFRQYAGHQTWSRAESRRRERCEREAARRNALDAAGCAA